MLRAVQRKFQLPLRSAFARATSTPQQASTMTTDTPQQLDEQQQTSPFYSLSAKTIKDTELPFSELKGKVVLLVNTASKCGFTPQYQGLQQLHDKYKDQGLVILGFPCDQFGHQEPGSETEIEGFCQVNYGVKFQMMSKIDVNGPNTHPVYQFLKHEKKQMMMERIKWNFEKFLVDKQGNVVQRFSSVADPIRDIAPAVTSLLQA